MPADFDPQVIGPVIVTYFVGRVADGLDLQQRPVSGPWLVAVLPEVAWGEDGLGRPVLWPKAVRTTPTVYIMRSDDRCFMGSVMARRRHLRWMTQ
jgi:hypothetical protein